MGFSKDILARIKTGIDDIATSKSVIDTINGNVDQSLSTTEGNLMGASGTHKDIIDAIAALSIGLSAKDASLLGIGVVPGFQDFFLTVADEASLDTSIWNEQLDNDGTISVEQTDVVGYMDVLAGTVNLNDTFAYTQNKRHISFKEGVTSLGIDGAVNFVNEEGSYLFALSNQSSGSDSTAVNGSAHTAGIHCDNDTVNAYSSNAVAGETTDISAFFAENTYVFVEIVITASDVKFYIDGTLRATHSTRVPDYVMFAVAAVRNKNGIQSQMKAQYTQAWGE